MTAARAGTDHYDVAIIGGGPAGAAAALTLRQQSPRLRIGLFERSNYRATRVGETLPPTVQPTLHRLGVWQAFLAQGHLRAAGTSAVWGTEALIEHEFLFDRFGDGWHLDRTRFDAMLADQAAASGVDVYRGGVAQIGREDDRWTVHLRRSEPRRPGVAIAQQSVTARFVIDATGRRADVAVGRGAQPIPIDQLAGVVIFFRQSRDIACSSGALVEAVHDGWWYSAPVPQGGLVASFMGDRDTLGPRWHQLDHWMDRVGETSHTSRRLAGAEPMSRPRIVDASSQRLDRCVGEQWVAVGAAAAALDPLCSQGIVSALRGGTLAAYATGDHLAGRPGALDQYANWLDREFDTYLDSWREFYSGERRWPESAFWSRRHRPGLPPTPSRHSPEPARALATVGGGRGGRS